MNKTNSNSNNKIKSVFNILTEHQGSKILFRLVHQELLKGNTLESFFDKQENFSDILDEVLKKIIKYKIENPKTHDNNIINFFKEYIIFFEELEDPAFITTMTLFEDSSEYFMNTPTKDLYIKIPILLTYFNTFIPNIQKSINELDLHNPINQITTKIKNKKQLDKKHTISLERIVHKYNDKNKYDSTDDKFSLEYLYQKMLPLRRIQLKIHRKYTK